MMQTAIKLQDDIKRGINKEAIHTPPLIDSHSKRVSLASSKSVLQRAAKEIDKHKNLENTAGSATTGRGRGKGRRPVSSASGGQQTLGCGLGRGHG